MNSQPDKLAALGRDFSDRMNKIYLIFIYPVDPVKKWDFLYYKITNIFQKDPVI